MRFVRARLATIILNLKIRRIALQPVLQDGDGAVSGRRLLQGREQSRQQLHRGLREKGAAERNRRGGGVL